MNDKTVPLIGQPAPLQGGTMAMSIDAPNRSEINDFVGQSRSGRLPDGKLWFKVTGRPLQGEHNEPNVLKVLVAALSAEAGETLSYRRASKAENQGGIDGYVQYSSGVPVPVQIVKAPSAKEYGADVAMGDWSIIVTVEEAAGWIVTAINRKVSGKKIPSIARRARTSMILALDIRHAGQLANEDVIAAFARQMPDAGALGFRSVWLVGSTHAGSRKLA